MPDIKKEVETRFLASFEDAAKMIMKEFPNIHTHVSSFIGGSANHIHVLGLDCLFTSASPDESDLLTLCVTTENINTLPEISVDVGWGHPSGYVEADLFETPMEFSKETLDAIEAGLPKLYDTLIEVIRRGRPTNQE